MSKLTPLERMIRARISLLMDQPFFGVLGMRLKLVEAPSGPMNPFGTMATDGVVITFSPDFVTSLTDAEIKGVLAHEIMHVANLHHLRRGRRDPKRWNIACDATINATLRETGFSLPRGGVDMPQYKNWASEAIYDALPENNDDGGGKRPPGPDDWGVVLDHPGQSEAEHSTAENEIRIAIKQAAKAQEMHDRAKNKGSQAAWLKRLIDEVCEPQVRWEDLLRRFVSSRIPYDYTWSRPSRRGIANGLYLPGTKKQGLGEVVFFIDTSGSISARELSHFVAEANYVLQDLHPERVHIVFCDAQVGNYITLNDGDDIPLDQIVGGGGSDFRPAFKYLTDNDIRPVAGIVLSDMLIDFPEQAPTFPVFMVTTTDTRGPDWGSEHVRLRT